MSRSEMPATATQIEAESIEKPAIVDFVTLKKNEVIRPWKIQKLPKNTGSSFSLSVSKYLIVPVKAEVRIANIMVTDTDIQAGISWVEQKIFDLKAPRKSAEKKIKKLEKKLNQLSLLQQYR